MDREILYRGINFQKEWVYGDLFHSYANDDIAIAYYREGSKTPTFDAIFPESFGQYTGLTDKNGVKIFEGDIISLGDPNIKYITMWRNDGFCAKQIGASSYIGLTYWASDIEVLGNVIDNPELIK
ncbi:YopX family protein [Prevotella melaninogenica]|jgi:putative prophage lp2 protein 26|uniref:YopX family protein n=1 Tax=Prevotella melaninogenica TaxID=28132 RepID=UPI001C5DBDE5|nr:YopX family protein [Prevotella melaninogenica]MBW4895358.1 YopX family protein [Prevotella melaninogenica]